jgi:hypothetical protein
VGQGDPRGSRQGGLRLNLLRWRHATVAISDIVIVAKRYASPGTQRRCHRRMKQFENYRKLGGRTRSIAWCTPCHQRAGHETSASSISRGLPMKHRLAVIASVGFAFVVPNATQGQQPGASSASPALDEIYVARSVRLSRVPATSFCDKSNTEVNRANIEDQYIFRAVATNPTDGRVTDADSTTVGTLHACFGPTDIPTISQFYGEFMFEGMAFKGFGYCINRPDFPEKGVVATRCYLNLFGLPDRYAGGGNW